MRAKLINEKFQEDFDPIHDMGIGKIKIEDVYNATMVPAKEKWEDFVNSLVGKTVIGRFADFTKDVTTGMTRKHEIFVNADQQEKQTIEITSVFLDELENPKDILVEIKEEKYLVMYGNEKYIIKS